MCLSPHIPVTLTGLLNLILICQPTALLLLLVDIIPRLRLWGSANGGDKYCCRKSYSYLPLSCRIQTSPIIYLFLLVPCHINLVNLILLLCCILHGRFCILLRKFSFYLLDALEKIHHQSACKNHKNKNNACNTRKSRFQLVASLKNGLK